MEKKYETVGTVNLVGRFYLPGRAIETIAKALHTLPPYGMFVPSISFGMPVIASLRKHTDMFFDVHS